MEVTEDLAGLQICVYYVVRRGDVSLARNAKHSLMIALLASADPTAFNVPHFDESMLGVIKRRVTELGDDMRTANGRDRLT